MPTIRAFLPAALRRRFSSAFPFVFTRSIAGPTQATGSGALAHAVTSLPPIETMIRPTSPRWRRRNRAAASACVLPAYCSPPGPSPLQPAVRVRMETDVTPPQAKLTSSKRCPRFLAWPTSW
jgi:hypothetical protein